MAKIIQKSIKGHILYDQQNLECLSNLVITYIIYITLRDVYYLRT